MSEAVHVDREDDVVTLTIDRPDVRNALTEEVTAGLRAGVDLAEAEGARCLVVTGSEGTFCAGGDVNTMLELQSDERTLEEAVRHVVTDLGRTVRRVHEAEVPTVARVEGAAVGAGVALMLACDVQVARADATVSCAFRRVGLAVDTGLSYLLPRVVGENVAKELVFTGERMDGETAAEYGLVNHAYPADAFDEEVGELVERVASGPTAALRASKRLLRRGLDGDMGEAIEREAATQAAILDTADHDEGVAAFLERRDPEFEGH